MKPNGQEETKFVFNKDLLIVIQYKKIIAKAECLVHSAFAILI